MVLGMLLAATVSVALVMQYNLGRTVESRSRLTHAADAAAYSGALEQARQLNFLAYVNRTQIAHQVAMAHLVTLGAAAQYMRTLAGQRNRNNPPAALIGMLFGPDTALAYLAARGKPGAEADLARAYAEHDRVVHRVLDKGAASAVAGLPASRDRLMRAVLQDNYSQAGGGVGLAAFSRTDAAPSLRLLSDGWPGFIQRQAATRRAGLRPAVEQAAARFGFLARRNETRRNPWPVSMYCPILRHELRRRGSTWLGPDGRWGALDTQSFHALRSNRWVGCYYREYAMGWGTAQGQKSKAPPDLEYVEAPPEDFSSQDFWRWVELSTNWNIFDGATNPMANSYAMAQVQRWPGLGLPGYREVALRRGAEPLRFAVAVSLAGNVLPTTDAASQVAAPAGRFRYAGLGDGGTLTVTSAAETYFARPDARPDGRPELATLFRPYWQARLSAVTPAETLLARGGR
nr:hypothetical protein [Achromobacter sp. UMC71]